MSKWLGAGENRSSAFAADVQLIADQAEAILTCEQGEQSCRTTDRAGTSVGAGGTTAPTTTLHTLRVAPLGDAQLRDLFAFASGAADTRIVFRGVDKDESLLAFVALGERIVERAFDQLRFEQFRAAGEDRERFVDPTITAAADIHLPNGSVLVRAGDSVNPLDRIPFTQRLVVFDAADSRQVAFVQGLAAEPSERPTTFLLTGLSR